MSNAVLGGYIDGCILLGNELLSVCIFLNIENPLSESAFEQGIESRPDINLKSKGNLCSPSIVSILPTSLQNAPVCGFFVLSAASYVVIAGRSSGESWKSKISSFSLSRAS